MKIGITCYPTYGGSGTVATELGHELAKRGHQVHFISYSLPYRLNVYDENIFFHEVTLMAYPLFEYPPYSLALAAKMAEVAEREDLDLLHVHYAIPHAVCAFLAKQLLGTEQLKVITTLHGTDITLVGNDTSFYSITKWSLEQSDGVTAVSHSLRDETVRHFCCEDEITVIPNFVDTQHFRRDRVQAERTHFARRTEKIICHISNFRPVKRVGDVIRVFSRIQSEVPAKLLLIGDGPDRSLAQSLSQELNISDRVMFLGRQESVAELLAISDLLLLPSEKESFGLAALEAMSCQVPVIASKTGGLPELISHGETGFLAAVGDVAAMARFGVQILSDDALRENLGTHGRQRVLKQFTTDYVVPMYEDLYREMIGRS
ncbi:MAG: N-acetyl-alpha-D-glucosaminyl L-malate synthase BshA [Gemmatimonadota bacterium]|nr:MAG: N-acetyl-alpha-D-glucosaminyl L-malate synthase BshA [Gemmatimonadota bacterium]